MDNQNSIQLKILSLLLYKPKSRFKDLNVDSLSTDGFSYHLRTLLADCLIKKEGYFYSLTSKGKMLAGKLDTSTNTIEKQAKIGILLIPHQLVDGKELFLIQQRLKEPYFGYWGFMTGKVRFGETLSQTGGRELLEETGMVGEFKFCYELHEMVYDKNTNQQLEDKFFQVVEVTNPQGNLVSTAEGHNVFMTIDEFRKITPKYHNEDDILNWFLDKNFEFKEHKYYIEKF